MRKWKDRSAMYKTTRILALDGTGKKTAQEDPLRGNVHEPLKTDEISRMYDYLPRGIKSPTSTSAFMLTQIMTLMPDLFEKLVTQMMNCEAHRQMASEATKRRHAINNAIREIAYQAGASEDDIRNAVESATTGLDNAESIEPMQPTTDAQDLPQTVAGKIDNLSLPYLLKRPSKTEKDRIATSIVSEWNEEVIPRLDRYGTDCCWWKEGDKAQKNLRQRAKSLYGALNRRVSANVDTDVCSAASTLDDIVESEMEPNKRSSCRADIQEIVVKVNKDDCDICDEDSIKECIRSRKRKRNQTYSEKKK